MCVWRDLFRGRLLPQNEAFIHLRMQAERPLIESLSLDNNRPVGYVNCEVKYINSRCKSEYLQIIWAQAQRKGRAKSSSSKNLLSDLSCRQRMFTHVLQSNITVNTKSSVYRIYAWVSGLL